MSPLNKRVLPLVLVAPLTLPILLASDALSVSDFTRGVAAGVALGLSILGVIRLRRGRV